LPINIRDLLRQYDLHPDKRLGQVFLVDNRSLKRIVDAAQISPQDNILRLDPDWAASPSIWHKKPGWL
jgi:16S rRNA (adenine1518-N6/adenine1519-N6)-dimethyltransferase